MGNIFFFEWEPKLMEWIQAHLGSAGIGFASICSTMGEEVMMVVLLCFLYFYWDKEAGKYVARRFMPVMVFNAGIKNIFCRLRPYFVHDNIQILKPVDTKADIYDIAAQGYSFPSGHSSNAASTYIATACAFCEKWITIVALVVTALVGISRFCVGAHYPTDVLCGWALGLVGVFGYTLLENKIKDRRIIYIILAVVTLPGFFYCTTNDFYTGYGMMIGFFLGDLFEERYVDFENTRNVIRGLLRIAVGGGLYLGLNALLKVPFNLINPDFLSSGTVAAYLVRTIRYTVVIFVVMGVYPMAFKKTDKFWKK